MKKAIVLGSINFDIVAVADRLPKVGETVKGPSIDMFVGGKGANQAVQIALMGAKTTFIGQIGRDDMGKIVQKALTEKGVSGNYLKASDEYRTGCASIYVDTSGNNMLVHAPGANHRIPTNLIDEAISEIQMADIFVTQNEINPDAADYGLRIARKAGVPTILNPAPAIVLDDSTYSFVDYITPNETESEVCTGIQISDLPFDQWKRKSAEWFLHKGVKNVCITLGDKGVYFYDGRNEYDIPAFPIEAVDTTAAGDAFNGGFAFGLANQFPISKCLQIGSACGALAATILGAQNSIHPADKVYDFISMHENC